MKSGQSTTYYMQYYVLKYAVRYIFTTSNIHEIKAS